MDLPSLDQLAAFRAVAREGGFSRAAAVLHKTQPAVSQAVRTLEERVGARLLERRGRGSTLTRAGRDYLAHVEQALGALERGAQALAASSELRSGQLRIAASDTATCHELPELLRAFRRRYPGVELRIANAPSPEVARLVRSREVDLGVATLPGPPPGLHSLSLGRREDVAILAPDHPLAARTRLRLGQLADQPWILLDRASATRRFLDPHLRAAGIDPDPAMEVASIEVIKRLVALGLGVSIVPRIAIEAELGRRELACTSVLPRRDQRETALLLPERDPGPAARAFAELSSEARR